METSLLLAVLALIKEGMKLAPQIMAALKRSGAMTDAEALEFTAEMHAAFASPEWQPRGPVDPDGGTL